MSGTGLDCSETHGRMDAQTTAQGWHREETNAAAGTENHHFRLTTVYAGENTQKELRAFFKATTSCWGTSDRPLSAAICGAPSAERSLRRTEGSGLTGRRTARGEGSVVLTPRGRTSHGLRGNSTNAPVWMLVGSLSRIFSWQSDTRGNASQKKVGGGSNTVHNPNALSNCSHIVG